MKKRVLVLMLCLALLLSMFPAMASAERGAQNRGMDSFTGIVTYRSARTVYVQSGEVGKLVLLDSSNDSALMSVVQKGKQVTVTGEAMTLNQGGYRIPEITDAMLEEVADTGATVAAVSAKIADLDNDLMARLVKVEATKPELTEAQLQLSLDDYDDDHTLTAVGVLSANIHGRILLGATVTAKHTSGNPVQENMVPATCVDDGSYDEAVYCTVCGKELSHTHRIIPKLGHTHGEAVRENETVPTCTQAGSYDQVVYCTVCGKELSRDQKTIAPLGHLPGEPERENEVPATVESEGSYDEVVYCTRCGAELSREHKVIGKLPCPLATITTQPKNVTVKSGTEATFTVKVAESNVTYQWYSRAPGVTKWTAVPDATKDSFTVVGTKANSGSQYRCGVRNRAGEAYSDAATLTVTLQPPVIQTQPKNQSVKDGSQATFSVKASGKGIVYQWFERASEAEQWTAVSGAAKASYTVVGTKENNGHQYRCLLKNDDGEICTKTVTLKVTPVKLVIKTQPKSVTVKSGAKAVFKVKVAKKNVTYQWYGRAPGVTTWTPMPNAAKAKFTVVGTKANNDWQYCCLVKDAEDAVYTKTVTLTVTPQPPRIKTQPKTAKVKSGARAKFAVKATGPNLEYQWYKCAPDANVWQEIPGAVKAAYSFVAAKGDNGWQYRCVVKNEDGSVTSKTVKVRVTPQPPKFKVQPKSAKVKSGTVVKLKVKAKGKGVTYQWFGRASKEADWEKIDGATAATLTVTVTAANSGCQYRCEARNEDGAAYSKAATLKLK